MELTVIATFRLGFPTNIMNPKSALFFRSAFAAALPSEPSLTLLASAVVLVYVNALVSHLLFAATFSHTRVQAGYARQRVLLGRFAALFVGAMVCAWLQQRLTKFGDKRNR
ncbi:MAG: hypothetical protein ACRCWJ_04000 [Casimicrobium sp.]